MHVEWEIKIIFHEKTLGSPRKRISDFHKNRINKPRCGDYMLCHKSKLLLENFTLAGHIYSYEFELEKHRHCKSSNFLKFRSRYGKTTIKINSR